MPDIACPVCHSMNAPTRTFCWKCAADLHAPVADASAPPPAPKVVVPLQPILLGVAVAAIALIAVVVVLLSGSPAATISPSGGSGALPTSAVSTDGGVAASAAPTSAPTDPAPTAPAATQAPKPTAAPATPGITPV